jgi:hypothetical protein
MIDNYYQHSFKFVVRGRSQSEIQGRDDDKKTTKNKLTLKRLQHSWGWNLKDRETAELHVDQLLSALYPPRSATEAKTHIPSLLLVDSLVSRGCKEDVRTQEPSASEHMPIADRSLTRLTNQMSSELAPLGLRALVRRGRCSVFFLLLLCQTPRTFTHF